MIPAIHGVVQEVKNMKVGEEFHFSELSSMSNVAYRTKYSYVYNMAIMSGMIKPLGNGYYMKVEKE